MLTSGGILTRMGRVLTSIRNENRAMSDKEFISEYNKKFEPHAQDVVNDFPVVHIRLTS